MWERPLYCKISGLFLCLLILELSWWSCTCGWTYVSYSPRHYALCNTPIYPYMRYSPYNQNCCHTPEQYYLQQYFAHMESVLWKAITWVFIMEGCNPKSLQIRSNDCIPICKPLFEFDRIVWPSANNDVWTAGLSIIKCFGRFVFQLCMTAPYIN